MMRIKRLLTVAIAAALLATVGAVVAFAATGGGSSGYGQMMGGRYVYRPANSAPVHTLVAARSDAQKFASRLGLRVDEVLAFQRNFYAKLVDSKGIGATEVLIDSSTGVVSLEYGPAMMWNTRYGMSSNDSSMMGSYGASMMGRNGSYSGMMGAYRGGSMSTSGYGAATMMRSSGYRGTMGGSGYGAMMGGYGSSSTGSAAPSPVVTVSLAGAHPLVQRWLDANEPGVKVETGGDAFPGYYTLETLKGGKITGMISVNATTGAVWPHWWHGAFIAKAA